MPTRSPVNDPGPDTTANRSDISELMWPPSAEPLENLAGKPLPMRARAVADAPLTGRSRARRETSATRDGLEREGQHRQQNVIACLFDTVTTSSTSPASMDTATPAMRQYLEVKRQHRDAIVCFRMGDFYELFYEDALVASRVLELTLTSRAKDAQGAAIPMCGVPFHALDVYLARLVRKGYRVAICDQVEDARKAKGLVRREVTRVVSPGTFTDASYLDAREPAFLAAVSVAGDERRLGAGVPRHLHGPVCGGGVRRRGGAGIAGRRVEPAEAERTAGRRRRRDRRAACRTGRPAA